MARPLKFDADYFPFYAKDGRTLFCLQQKYGLEGVGFFTNLMRLLTLTPNHYLCLQDESDRIYFFSKIGIEEERGTEMLELMIKTEKIHRTLWENYKVIVSEDHLNSLKPLYERRKQEMFTIEKIVNVYKNQVNVDNNPVNVGLMQQKQGLCTTETHKVEYSIVKKSKERRNIKEESTEEKQCIQNKPQRKKREPDLTLGEFENVRLTTEEKNRLEAEHGKELVDAAIILLSMWKEEKGKRVKNDNLALRRWAIDAAYEKGQRQKSNTGISRDEWEDIKQYALEAEQRARK